MPTSAPRPVPSPALPVAVGPRPGAPAPVPGPWLRDPGPVTPSTLRRAGRVAAFTIVALGMGLAGSLDPARAVLLAGGLGALFWLGTAAGPDEGPVEGPARGPATVVHLRRRVIDLETTLHQLHLECENRGLATPALRSRLLALDATPLSGERARRTLLESYREMLARLEGSRSEARRLRGDLTQAHVDLAHLIERIRSLGVPRGCNPPARPPAGPAPRAEVIDLGREMTRRATRAAAGEGAGRSRRRAHLSCEPPPRPLPDGSWPRSGGGGAGRS